MNKSFVVYKRNESNKFFFNIQVKINKIINIKELDKEIMERIDKKSQ